MDGRLIEKQTDKKVSEAKCQDGWKQQFEYYKDQF